MEEDRKKYVNMQKLCLEIDSNNEWIISLVKSPLEMFLATIRKKMLDNPNCNTDSMYRNIIEISLIEESNIKEDDKVKIKRYIEYFMKIVKVI